MSNYFIFLFFRRKHKIKLILIVSSIVCGILLLIFGVFYFFSVYILSNYFDYTVKKIQDITQIKCTYNTDKMFFKSKIIIKDFNIVSDNYEMKFDDIEIAKKSGILLPNKININYGDLYLKKKNKDFKFVKEGNKDGIEIKFSRDLLQTAKFRDFKLNSYLNYIIIEEGKEIGNVNIDKIEVKSENQISHLNYKGGFIIKSGTLIEDSSLFGAPIKWDINFLSYQKQELEGFNNEKKIETNYIKFNNSTIDFDYSKVNITGDVSFSTDSINNIDLDVLVENDAKFVDNSFNMVLRKRNDNLMTIKKMHNYFKNVLIPKLKTESTKSTNKDLFLKIQKTKYMPEITINGIGVQELTDGIFKSMR